MSAQPKPRRVLRLAKNNQRLRFARRDEIALSDSLAATAGIIRTRVRGLWVDAYVELAPHCGGIGTAALYAAWTTANIPVCREARKETQ